MKTFYSFKNRVNFLILAGLILILFVGWNQAAWAQAPDESGGELITTVEPISPIATPPVKVIITVEPINTAEPTEEPPPTVEPEPTDEPGDDDVGIIIDPPGEAEMGDPIKNDTSVAKDDREDSKDSSIDILDLTFVASRYGSDDPAADINLDGTVNIFDLTILASHYGKTEPPADAVIITPEPDIEVSGAAFGEFDLPVTYEGSEAESQYYGNYRPLRIGISMNYFKVYDSTDYNSAPDPYALMSVGGVSVRTGTKYNTYEDWPYWRLGWWRYSYFPQNSYSNLPINIELRDDDGYVCYGYYGCRYQCQYIDVSPSRYNYAKQLTLYPSQCKVVDETGATTYGSWLNNNRCRVYLQSWGGAWPRGYISYYIDAQWD